MNEVVVVKKVSQYLHSVRNSQGSPVGLENMPNHTRPFTTPGGRFSVRSGGIAFIGDNTEKGVSFLDTNGSKSWLYQYLHSLEQAWPQLLG